MKNQREQALYDIHEAIDEAISPSNMTAEKAKDFLEELQSDIQAKIDGIKDDLKAQEND